MRDRFGPWVMRALAAPHRRPEVKVQVDPRWLALVPRVTCKACGEPAPFYLADGDGVLCLTCADTAGVSGTYPSGR